MANKRQRKRNLSNSASAESMIRALRSTAQALDAAFDSCRVPHPELCLAMIPPVDLAQSERTLGHVSVLSTPSGEGNSGSVVLRLPLVLSLGLATSDLGAFSVPFSRVSNDRD
jgi:hypothetical protein